MLEFLAFIAAALAVFIGPISRRLEKNGQRPPDSGSSEVVVSGFALRKRRARPATKVLRVFSVFVAVLGVTTALMKWNDIVSHRGEILYFVWLVTVMVFGMLAQVLDQNIREHRSWHRLTATELLLPTLFSIVVFYPIWSSVASGQHGYFSFYSAFLNGYFWKTIVASAKPPAGEPPSST